MSCTHFEAISALVDDELGADDAATAQRHLFQCEDCRDAYRAMRSIRGSLLAQPASETLPLRVDLSLTALAQQWLDDERGVAKLGRRTDPGTRFENPAHSRHWRHFLAAAAAALLVLVGMGLVAPKGSSVLTLSAFEPNVYGLSSFGQSALSTHVEHATTSRHVPVASTLSLQGDLRARLGFPVALPSSRFGAALDARAIEVDGERVAMVDYRFNETPVTLFALPREFAIDRLDLEFEDEVPAACTAQDIHTCYGDDAGTSLCVWGDSVQAYIWIAHMPLSSLDKLTRPRR